MGAASDIATKAKSKLTAARAKRKRENFIQRIGELTYLQRTDSTAVFDNEIQSLVEEVRHIDRAEELRQRQELAED